MGKVWLEVALNGPWSKEMQAGIPITVEKIIAEGIACAKSGAAIVHVHAYDVKTGLQKDDAGIYKSIIEGIRSKVDAIVYPTIPLAGSPNSPSSTSPAERYKAVATLGKEGLLEWAVVDPGTTTFARYDDIKRNIEGFVYLNPENHIREGLQLARLFGFRPAYACYEPAFVRLGAALAARFDGLPTPIYRFMFSDCFTFGFPPREYGLEAYTKLLEEAAPGMPWMIGGLGVDIRPLIAMTVSAGGHIRVGLEDAVFGTKLSNVQWVEETVSCIVNAGGEPASASEVRAALKR